MEKLPEDLEVEMRKLSDQDLIKIFFKNGGTMKEGDIFCVPFPTCPEGTLAHYAYRVLSDNQRMSGRKVLFILMTKFRNKEIDKCGNRIPK